MVSMNRLSFAERAEVVRCLVEGNSIRSTVRIAGVAKNTAVKLLVELGAACSQYQDQTFRTLNCGRLQLCETFSFVSAKQRNVAAQTLVSGHAGDVWTWTAIDADSKLVPCWMLGPRDAVAAREFVSDLAARLSNRVQVTSDGLKVCVGAIDAFQGDADYAQLVEVYGGDVAGQTSCSPANCVPDRVGTNFVECQNLTMRIGTRRFSRWTNAPSKKEEDHAAALALHFMWYNFGRRHQVLKTTPAVAAGVADHIWTVEELVALHGPI
jgi:IS1 family transposase